MSDSPANLPGRIATLENELARVSISVDAIRRIREPLGDVHLQVRKAKTCNPSGGGYPVAGDNVYPIVFVDADFVNTPGSRTLNADARQAAQATCALSSSSVYIPVGTVVDVYQCRGLGDQDAGDWFILDGTGDGRIHRFRLTADLSNGGVNVAAKILTFNGTNYVEGGDCYVSDWYALTGAPGSSRGMWQGKATMEGIGLRREVNSTSGSGPRIELDIVWMETYAWDGEVTLLEDPVFTGTDYASAWSGSAIVNKAFHQGVFPGSGSIVTVYDDQCMYPFAKSGAVAKITRSEYEGGNPYYKVLVCQQLALTARGTLSGSMCAASTATIAGFTVTSPSPFNLLPLSPTITNPRGHAGQHGDDVWLAFNKEGPVYEISDMELHAVSVINNLRQSGAFLQANYRTIYVERCETTDFWLSIMAMNQFNWWCSGSYYQYCSGSLTSGSGSGSSSGDTGASCDCTTLPDTLRLFISAAGTCWHGEAVTLTRSGTTWSWSGTIRGDSWAFSWACESTGDNILQGTLTISTPGCLAVTTGPRAAIPSFSNCDPPHITFELLNYTSISGCAECTDVATPGDIGFFIVGGP